jgi:galactose mutarotase-like enzyme
LKELLIKNKSGTLTGVVLPDYGGMLAKLYYHGIRIFALDERMLPISNVLAGGNPVLFPFPSKTKDDSYESDGKEYSMPFHGLVKSSQFGVADVRDDEVTLYIESTDVNKKENYPFDYRLELTYSLKADRVDFITVVHNRSDRPMPHYFGWHPWFFVTDKANFQLKARMGRYLDYSDGRTYPNTDQADMTKKTNYIFDERSGNETWIKNPVDGYQVKIVTDDAFDVLVVCTDFDGAICVEPWLGAPDTIHRGDYVKWVDANGKADYRMSFEIDRCEA